jgi:hypothetical protein
VRASDGAASTPPSRNPTLSGGAPSGLRETRQDLAFGGPDYPVQMIALCPNCHAIKTRGRSREELRPVLLEAARQHHHALLDEQQQEARQDG